MCPVVLSRVLHGALDGESPWSHVEFGNVTVTIFAISIAIHK